MENSDEADALLERLIGASGSVERRRIPTRRLVLGATAIAASVAVVLAVLPGSPERPQSAAATTLGHLADVAAARPVLTLRPGQYLYSGSTTWGQTCDQDAGGYCYVSEARNLYWQAANDSGRRIQLTMIVGLPTAADRAGWLRNGQPRLPLGRVDIHFGPGEFRPGPASMAKLPTNPVALAKLLRERKIQSGPEGPAEDFAQIGDLLRYTGASPTLHAAVYRVAQGIPGVKVLGAVKDHSGRMGLGIARDDGPLESEYIFDPKTSALLGERTVVVGSYREKHGGIWAAVAKGTMLSWAVYVPTAIVDSLTDTPYGKVPPPGPVTCTAVGDAGLDHGRCAP